MSRLRRVAGAVRAKILQILETSRASTSVPMTASTAPGAAEVDALIAIANALSRIPTNLLLTHALASGSPVMRDVLVLRATRGEATWRSLRDTSTLDVADIPTMVQALRVVASRAGDHEDRVAIGALAAVCADRWPRRSLRPLERRTLVELLITHGDARRAERLLGSRLLRGPAARLLFLDIDKALHRAGTGPGRQRRWDRDFSRLFTTRRLDPVFVADSPDGLPPFDRLSCRPVAAIDGGPLITVVMTAFRPGRELLSAVDSVVAQSWSRWELLIIDDGSGEESDEILGEAGRRDRRIRVVRNSDNAGTYVRRNEGVALASGEFVTMHDSDDWAHPRRLERQVSPLLADPQLVATLSCSVRATDDLDFVQPRGAQLRLTETSLLFRRDRALALAGMFDSVRRAADSGYRLRLEQATGRSVPVVEPEAPLSIVRFRRASLSGSELGDGWMHPARYAYAGAHEHWMTTQSRAGRSIALGFPLDERPFPAPPHLLGLPPASHELDILLVTDVRLGLEDQERAEGITREARRWAGQGHRVGILRADAPQATAASRLARPSILELFASGEAIEVLAGDGVTARLVVVRDEASLLGLPDGSLAIESRTVLIEAAEQELGDALSGARAGSLRRLLAKPDEARTRIVTDSGQLNRALNDVTREWPSDGGRPAAGP